MPGRRLPVPAGRHALSTYIYIALVILGVVVIVPLVLLATAVIFVMGLVASIAAHILKDFRIIS